MARIEPTPHGYLPDLAAPSRCWCGNENLLPFSPDYLKCADCQTLVLAHMPPAEELAVTNDSDAYYGRNYFNRVSEKYNQPRLEDRARTDLPERCAYWLRTLLKYLGPPAMVLELGCAHGGFVALLRSAGFDATGLDLSRELVREAENRFGVSLLTGPVESQAIAPESLDAILLMDVIEHFPDPLATMRHCASLLKPTGLFLVQTPQYPEQRSFAEMQTAADPFLDQLKPDQHLFLFSKSSLCRFFEQVGAGHVEFEPAIFAHYDQFVVAGKEPLKTVDRVLAGAGEQRLVQALLDSRTMFEDACAQLQQSEEDRGARLKLIRDLEQKLAESEFDRAARLRVIEDLGQRLATSDADRNARLEIIQRLQSRLEALEAEPRARTPAISEPET